MAGQVKRGSVQIDTKGNEVGKVFVGGLSWDTSEDTLKETFSKFGEVTDCCVMRNSETGNSRGFGFLTFRDSDSVEMVIAGGPHIVDGRHVDAKPCNKKVAAAQRATKKTASGKENKVFVGGLPIDVTEEVMRDFFNQFGNVTEVLIMFNQQKQRPRGFGFVSFDGEESIEHLVQQHYLTMNGKQIEIKRAEPRYNKGGGFDGAMGAPEAWMSQGAGDIWGTGAEQYAMNGAGAGAYATPDYSQYAQAGTAGYQASTAAYQQAWSQAASQAAGYGQQPAAAYGWPPQTPGAPPQGYGPYSQQPQAGYGAAPGGQPGQGPPGYGAYPGAAGFGAPAGPPSGPPGPPGGQGPSAPQGMYGVDGGAPGYGPPGGAAQPGPPGYGGSGAPGGDPSAGYGRPPAGGGGGGGGGQPGYHPYRR